MAILVHGTTRSRAEQMMSEGPDPDYREGGDGPKAEGFSTYLEPGPFVFGTPADFACANAALFPNEGGPAILAVDVPDDIIALAADPVYFPLRRALTALDCGVLQLVDDLLEAASEQSIRVDWLDGHCRVRSFAATQNDTFEVPLRKSVFRAALARIAVLCNEQRPSSVSPYGGQGELTARGHTDAMIQVVFTNTPGVQSLELIRLAQEWPSNGRGEPEHGIRE